MAHKWLKYSYAAQKDKRHRIRWWVILFAVFFLLYIILSTFFFSTGVVENDTMAGGIRKGDRFIFFSRYIYRILPDEAAGFSLHPGDIVLVDTSQGERKQFFTILLDSLVRFFTAQRISFSKHEEHLFIKRIIALPGDEVSMTNFVIRVKPAGGSYSLTEFEITGRPYNVAIPQVPALWDESLPFSGNMEPLVLGENECFVLSDDRGNTNDSRTWGPVPMDFIAGEALFRYWPLTRLGRP
jgi:signal peptidase I